MPSKLLQSWTFKISLYYEHFSKLTPHLRNNLINKCDTNLLLPLIALIRQNCNFHYDFCYFITFFREAIVVWSSWESFKAVWTLEAFATISAFSSRHFCINRFSLSWDFFNALCNFSYSTRNFSRLLSPMSSPRTYKAIEKSKWFMDNNLAILSSREYYDSNKHF